MYGVSALTVEQEWTVKEMPEYIERNRLMQKIDVWEQSAREGTNPNCKNGNEYEAAMDIAIMVEEAPVVRVREDMRGEWKLYGNDDDIGSSYFCSNCHHSYDEELFYPEHGGYIPYNYCPNCGARMDEDYEEDDDCDTSYATS